MNICLENVNLGSLSGPNSFARKLVNYVSPMGHNIVNDNQADLRLCFIESFQGKTEAPLFQRLDGIYFNTVQDFQQQNANIKRTYENADGVIFQSNFNKKLTFEYFGEHSNTAIIHNGADTNLIKDIQQLRHSKLEKYDNIWSCASSWRPHKRLSENIRYFFEHSDSNDCLIVAGSVNKNIPKDERIFYVGEVDYERLLSIYKASKCFIHLSWLDHCPNVVVDARASGCQIICSSTGGTKEIAGLDAIVIEENEWDLKPLNLYDPPLLNFNNKIKNSFDVCYDMEEVAKKYINFFDTTLKQ
tara:strand:- start:9616 stop:10518 length:903 start_codon:yes stop_codon:yes gene_type:complete